MLYKSTPLRLKDMDAKQGIIQAYWSAFGNEDDGGDIVQPGAFTKTIAEWGPGSAQPRIKWLWQHDSGQLLGKPSALVQDAFGLLATAQIVKTTLGQDVLMLYEAGVINEHSIGYETVLASFDPKLRARMLQELKLYEGSSVTWGMNSQTPTVAVKALTDAPRLRERVQRLDAVLHRATIRTDSVGAALEDELKALRAALAAVAPEPRRERPVDIKDPMPKADEERAIKYLLAMLEAKGASGKATWPIGDRATAWDNGAAHKRIETWANGDTAKLKSVHFWSPTGDDAADISKYKLLFCDVSGDKVEAMPRGIFACAGSHGVDAADIPDADKAAARTKIEGYYARMAKQFDDETIVAPWKSDAGKGGTMPDDTKPAKRAKRPAKARDFVAVYTTDRDAWDLLEDLDDMWEALRESITGILVEGAATGADGINLQATTSLGQFTEAVQGWIAASSGQQCWADIADAAEEAADYAADRYGSGIGYYGSYYYASLVRRNAEAKGKQLQPLEDAPDAPPAIKAGAQLSGTNRGKLTTVANGMAAAMGDMKTHHKALTQLLKDTDPARNETDAATGTEDDPGDANSAGSGGSAGRAAAPSAKTDHTAPDRSKAGTTRDEKLDALLATLTTLTRAKVTSTAK